MRALRDRGLRATAELERDLTGSSTRVFVPAIMGAGLVVSLIVVLTDLGRALRPTRSGARRDVRLQRDAVALVAPSAEAIGVPPPRAPRLQRRLRARATYLVVSVATVSLGLYVAIGSTFNYLRPDGYVEGVLWIYAGSLAASAFFVGVALVALVLALGYPDPPAWARSLVDRTPFGVGAR